MLMQNLLFRIIFFAWLLIFVWVSYATYLSFGSPTSSEHKITPIDLKLKELRPILGWNKCIPFYCSTDVELCSNSHNVLCCREVLGEMMVDIDKIFHKYNLTYFATFGTLLGIEREGSLIPWTLDNDISMNVIDLQRLENNYMGIRDELEEAGYHMFHYNLHRLCFTDRWRSGILKRYPPTAQQLEQLSIHPLNYAFMFPFGDIFVTEETELYVRIHDCIVHRDVIYPLTTSKMAHGNAFVDIPVPRDSSEWLAHVYGNYTKRDSMKQAFGDTKCGDQW